jgi:hypothetical protein
VHLPQHCTLYSSVLLFFFATHTLEGRSKLGQLEKPAEPYANVVFDAHEEAPEDHLHINLRNAWVKAEQYYRKLDDSPVCYAATCLYPYYKYYRENS